MRSYLAAFLYLTSNIYIFFICRSMGRRGIYQSMYATPGQNVLVLGELAQ